VRHHSQRLAKTRNVAADYVEENDRMATPTIEKSRIKSLKFGFLRRLSMSPVLIIGLIAGVGVPINALFLQDGRHPAPFFSKGSQFNNINELANAPIPPMRPPETLSTSSRMETDKLEAQSHNAKIKNIEAETLRSSPTKLTAPHLATKAQKTSKTDEISQLIEAGKPQKIENNDVIFLQRALLKLGYVVKTNGIWNKATKHALEKYQRDNGIPVNGAITPKILSQLAQRSGYQSE